MPNRMDGRSYDMEVENNLKLTGRGPVAMTAVVTATLAEINAGKVIVAGVRQKKIRVTDFLMIVTGNFATSTDIRLGDSAGTPVEVATLGIAGATDGAIVSPTTATNLTLGAGFAAYLTAGKSLKIRQTGTAATGGTSVKVIVTYTHED